MWRSWHRSTARCRVWTRSRQAVPSIRAASMRSPDAVSSGPTCWKPTAAAARPAGSMTGPRPMAECLPTGQPPPDEPLIRVEGLSRHFDVSPPWLQRTLGRLPRLTLKAVDGVSFEIRRGETFGLVGESGCGKSTLARLIVGEYPPTAGSIRFEGTDLVRLHTRASQSPFRRRMQMIFQDPYASLNPRWKVRNIIAEPIRTFRLAENRADVDRHVAELLLQVGLNPSDGAKYPHEFSGGQRQRISIARALSGNPDFIVCDEPTSALDVSVQAQILNLMKRLQSQLGLTYLFISHNLAVVRHISDRVGVMYLGRLVEVAPRSE